MTTSIVIAAAHPQNADKGERGKVDFGKSCPSLLFLLFNNGYNRPEPCAAGLVDATMDEAWWSIHATEHSHSRVNSPVHPARTPHAANNKPLADPFDPSPPPPPPATGEGGIRAAAVGASAAPTPSSHGNQATTTPSLRPAFASASDNTDPRIHLTTRLVQTLHRGLRSHDAILGNALRETCDEVTNLDRSLKAYLDAAAAAARRRPERGRIVPLVVSAPIPHPDEPPPPREDPSSSPSSSSPPSSLSSPASSEDDESTPLGPSPNDAAGVRACLVGVTAWMAALFADTAPRALGQPPEGSLHAPSDALAMADPLAGWRALIRSLRALGLAAHETGSKAAIPWVCWSLIAVAALHLHRGILLSGALGRERGRGRGEGGGGVGAGGGGREGMGMGSAGGKKAGEAGAGLRAAGRLAGDAALCALALYFGRVASILHENYGGPRYVLF